MNNVPIIKLKGLRRQTAAFMQSSGHWTQFHETISKLAEDGPPIKTCQWLYGEPKKRLFCGAETKPNTSWCPEHYRICFTPEVKQPVDIRDAELREGNESGVNSVEFRASDVSDGSKRKPRRPAKGKGVARCA